MALQWNEKLNVNVRIFNNHHKKLIDLINELDEAMLTGKTQDVISKTLNALSDYTIYHFGEEERLMMVVNYHGYTNHKEQHERFIVKIRECVQKYNDGRITVSIELMNFLSDWLKSHIMGTDKKYTYFFNTKGVL